MRRRAGVLTCVLALAAVACGGPANRDVSPATHPVRHDPGVPVVAKATSGRTLFVSPAGSDASPGTQSAPWHTLGVAISRLRPGDRLYVRAGFYVERIKLRVVAGRAGAPILVSGYRNEKPLIVGQLWLGEPSYWRITRLNVTANDDAPNEPMVRIYGGTHWVLAFSNIFGAHSTSALHIDDGPRNDLGTWSVIGSCIHDTYPRNGPNQDHNIYVDDMSRSPNARGRIERNLIWNAPNGRGIKLGPGGRRGGPHDVLIRNNTIYGSVQNISVSQGTSNVEIERNILYRARDANIAAYQLHGTRDFAHDNVAGAAPQFIDNANSGRKVGNGRHNHYPVSMRFDGTSCSTFHPTTHRDFGRYGR